MRIEAINIEEISTNISNIEYEIDTDSLCEIMSVAAASASEVADALTTVLHEFSKEYMMIVSAITKTVNFISRRMYQFYLEDTLIIDQSKD